MPIDANASVIIGRGFGPRSGPIASLRSITMILNCACDLHLWIAQNLSRDNLTVEVLAEQVQMSPHNFARLYKLKTRRTLANAVKVLRLEAPRRLLEDSERNIDQIARQCGFGDEERMRFTFQRNLRISPRDYRNRFSR